LPPAGFECGTVLLLVGLFISVTASILFLWVSLKIMP